MITCYRVHADESQEKIGTWWHDDLIMQLVRWYSLERYSKEIKVVIERHASGNDAFACIHDVANNEVVIIELREE